MAIDNQHALTDAQEELADAAVTLGSLAEAAKKVGASENDVRNARRSKRLQRSLHEKRDALIKTDGGTKAVQTIMDLMDPKYPAAVRLNAAKLMAGLAGHTEAADAANMRDLADMTSEELAAFIAQADGALASKADAARPVRRVVEGVAQGNAD